MAARTRYSAVITAGLLILSPAGAGARSTGASRGDTPPGTATVGGAPQTQRAAARRPSKRRAAQRRAERRREARLDAASARRPGTRGFVSLRAGTGYRLMRPHRAFGTRYAVAHLRKVLAADHAAHPEGPGLVIGDLSRRNGGRMRPHRSHRNGRDVDIWLPKVAARGKLDLARTWELISALKDSGAVEMIFLDYRLQRVLYRYGERELGVERAALNAMFEYPTPRKPKGPIDSLVIHSDGHRDHLHVRFRPGRLSAPPTT